MRPKAERGGIGQDDGARSRLREGGVIKKLERRPKAELRGDRTGCWSEIETERGGIDQEAGAETES